MQKIDDNFIAKEMKRIQESSRLRAEEEKRNKEQQRDYNEKNNLIKLEEWPNAVRGVPNSTLRCSLFAAIQPRYAKLLKKKVLLETNKLKVMYTGGQLTQFDLDVWEYALHLARKQNLGNKIYISEYAFLKGLGKQTGLSQRKQISNSFDRMIACCLHIVFKNGDEYKGSIVHEWAREENSGKMFLQINPRIARLFESGYTYINWEERHNITGKPLALWLHGYISTHAQWYSHKVETIRSLSGSHTKDLWKFRQNLISALKDLRKFKIIEEFKIDEDDLLYITRLPSKSQQKHLDLKYQNK